MIFLGEDVFYSKKKKKKKKKKDGRPITDEDVAKYLTDSNDPQPNQLTLTNNK